MKILGIVLIILGVVALVYGGFSYTTTKKAVDMGPIQIDKKEKHSVPLPPVLGVFTSILTAPVIAYLDGTVSPDHRCGCHDRASGSAGP